MEQNAARTTGAQPSRKRKKRRDRFDWWKLPWLMLIPLGLLWPQLLAGRAAWVEQYYSTGVYPVVKDGLSVLTSLVPISVAELILYALVLGTAIELLGSLVLWLFRRISWRRVLSVALNVGITAGVILNLFYFTWGFNYFREPLQSRMGLPVRTYETAELTELTAYFANEANAARLLVSEDARCVCTFTGTLQDMLNAMPDTYAALGETEPVFAQRTTRAKRVLFSSGLSWAGIAGVYIGLTGEPNINAAQPPLLIPQGAAHETAHQLGIASEDAAEFAGCLACLRSEDPFVRYSGTINALLHCRSALRKVDPEAARAIRDAFSDAVVRDLVDYDAYWDAFNGPVEQTVNDANDAYLKHNAQDSGVKSYGEVVDLLLAYYDQTIR